MRICGHILAALMLLCLMGSCGRGTVSEADESGLLAAVPSDALAVAECRNCDTALDALLDSTNILRTIDYGRLSKADAVLALCYDGRPAPLLILDASGEKSDTSLTINSIRIQAQSRHLESALSYCEAKRVLIITSSESVLPLAQRHMDIGASILDAPGFRKALACTGGSRNTVMFRTDAAQKLIKGGIPEKLGLKEASDRLQRKKLIIFLKKTGDWIVEDLDHGTLKSASADEKEVPGDGTGAGYTAALLSGVRDSEIPVPIRDAGNDSADSEEPAHKTGHVSLPPDADFMLDIILKDGFRKAYEEWTDAISDIDSYRDTLKARERETGKDPLDWEKELGVREVARIVWQGHEVTVLATSGRAKGEMQIDDNPCKGFIKALYSGLGSDDSVMARTGNLAIFGKPEDIKAYLDAPKEKIKGKISFRLISGNTTLSSDGSAVRVVRGKGE